MSTQSGSINEIECEMQFGQLNENAFKIWFDFGFYRNEIPIYTQKSNNWQILCKQF